MRKYLILVRGGTKSPETGKHEIRFIHFPGTVRRTFFQRKETLEQRAQHLYVRYFRYRRNDFESGFECLYTRGHVFFEQHH